MAQLYAIGNGFDLYHGLDTNYKTFGFFLKENYPNIYDFLLKYIGLPDLDSPSDGNHSGR